MGRPEKVPMAVTTLEEKEIGQGPDRGGKVEGNMEDAVPITNHIEMTEETEVIFSGQEEEDSTFTDTGGGDVNGAKKQQLSGNDMTNVIDVSDANNSQGSEPMEKVGKTIGGEGKSEVL